MIFDNDRPISNLKNDCLDFQEWAKKLSTVAMQNNPPTCVGVFGEWGSGKTSLMNLIKEEIENSSKRNLNSFVEKNKKEWSLLPSFFPRRVPFQNIFPILPTYINYKTREEKSETLIVEFNPTKFESSKNLIVPLFTKIQHAISKRDDFLDNALSDVLKIAASLLLSIDLGKVIVPYNTILSKLSGSSIIGSKEKHFFSDKDKILQLARNGPLGIYQALDQISSEMETSFSNSGIKRIVVFLDDLDRTHPDAAVKLLGQIKLILDQPNFVFFIGLSKEIIKKYLTHKYEKDYGIDGEYGNEYLNKLIPVPFDIPTPNKKQIKVLIENRAIKNGLTLSKKEKDIIIICSKQKPRKAVRLLNILYSLKIKLDGKENKNNHARIEHYLIWLAMGIHGKSWVAIKQYIGYGNSFVLGFLKGIIENEDKRGLDSPKIKEILERKINDKNGESVDYLYEILGKDTFLLRLITHSSFKEIINSKNIRRELMRSDVEEDTLEDDFVDKKFSYEVKLLDFTENGVEKNSIIKRISEQKIRIHGKERVFVKKIRPFEEDLGYWDTFLDLYSLLSKEYVFILDVEMIEVKSRKRDEIFEFIVKLCEIGRYVHVSILCSLNTLDDGVFSEKIIQPINNKRLSYSFEERGKLFTLLNN